MNKRKEIEEDHANIDTLITPKSEKSRLFLEILESENVDNQDEENYDTLFIKTLHNPYEANNSIVQAFIYNGDCKKGLFSKPLIWLYFCEYTLLRCFYQKPEVAEEIVVFDEDVLYNITSDVMLRTNIDIVQHCTTCRVHLKQGANGRKMRE